MAQTSGAVPARIALNIWTMVTAMTFVVMRGFMVQCGYEGHVPSMQIASL